MKKLTEDEENKKPTKEVPVVVSDTDTDIIQKELEVFTDEQRNIVPKKVNWDLKEQVSEKIEKLKRRTQRSIVEILREKLDNEESNSDID